MNSLFDNLQTVAHNTTTGIMGYPATWIPTVNNFSDDFGNDFQGPQFAKVLYKDATEKDVLGGVTYDQPRFSIEYLLPQFSALKKLADQAKANPKKREKIIVVVRNEPKEFFVIQVDTKYDGRTCIAYLDLIEPEDEA